jgi:hypothetical protein
MICEICKQPITCSFSMFKEAPYIDGKKYDNICFLCASLPSTYEYDELTNALNVYQNYSPHYLNDAEYLQKEGWSKQEIDVSIRAVNKIINNTLTIQGPHIYECLFILHDALDQDPVDPKPPAPLAESDTDSSVINT